MASVLEQLMAVLSPEERAIVQAKIDPKLVAVDKKNEELFGYWTAVDTGAAFEEPVAGAAAAAVVPPVAAAAAHVPVVPGTVSAAAQPITSASSPELKSILDTLTGLKLSIDDRFKNVVTMDKVNELGARLVNEATTRALYQADEISQIRETNRREFGKELDRAVFEKFVTDAAYEDPTTKVKRNKYATLTDAYNAMVGEERVANRVKTEVDTQVKQKLSAATVPGQTTSTGLSAAQQVMAKSKAEANGNSGKTRIQAAIDALAARERARESGGEMVQ